MWHIDSRSVESSSPFYALFIPEGAPSPILSAQLLPQLVSEMASLLPSLSDKLLLSQWGDCPTDGAVSELDSARDCAAEAWCEVDCLALSGARACNAL